MTAARAEQPGAIPAREWRDADGHRFQLLGFNPGDQCAIGRVTDRRLSRRIDQDVTAAVAFTSAQLREVSAAALDLAEALENTPGRNRRTWRWHITEGERLLSQARNHIDPTALVTRATGHFQAAAALRGQTTVHIITASGRDIE